MCVGACTETCEHVYVGLQVSILIYTHRVYECVCVCVSQCEHERARAGYASVRMLCFSVCQFHFALYE